MDKSKLKSYLITSFLLVLLTSSLFATTLGIKAEAQPQPPFKPGSKVAMAKQTNDILTALTVGNNGALHVSWVVGVGKWQGPVPISPPNIFPPGASVAMAKQTPNQLTAVAVGSNGALHVSWVVGGGKWQGPVQLTAFIELPPNADPDGDGLPNSWEQNGVDVNNDRRIDLNLPGLGANPMHKDIFIEADFMQNHRPNAQAINNVVARFAAAQVSNPDGRPGIALHVQVGDQIAHQETTTLAGLQTIKNSNFGTAAERSDQNQANIIAAKRGAFHYGLFAHSQPGSSSSGIAELPGNDFIVSLGAAGWGDSDGNGHPDGSIDQQEGTFMHEFGHNLNLRHGGGDNTNFKPNYLSVMNYLFQMSSNVANRPLDYSRCVVTSLNENNLNEPAGIGASCPPGLRTLIRSINLLTQTAQPVDYNMDGDRADNGLASDLNADTASSALASYNDWANILYNFRTIGAGASGAATGTDFGGPPPPGPEYSVENLKRDRLSLLAGIERLVQTLPPAAFTSPEAAGEAKSTFSEEIRTAPTESIAALLNTGNLDGAIQELTSLKSTADSTVGGAAANDLISAPAAQQELNFMINNLIQTLEKQK